MATIAGNEFAERYRKLADGELLLLANQRPQLAPAASAALDAELAARALRPEAIREFEDQTAARTEPESEDATRELPPPCELPDDWFDDNSDEPASSIASLRPKGVTVCSLSFWSLGIAMAGLGAMIIFQKLSLALMSFGLVGMFLGVALCAVGSGLWRMKPWSRQFAEAFCWLSVVLAIFSVLGNAYMRLRGFAVDPMIAIVEFMTVLWQLLWALYLGRESTRQTFLAAGREAESRRTQSG